MTLLLVDDKPGNLVALRAILEPLGHTLISVTSGRQALQVALREKLSLVLLDARMPEMDGFEVAHRLKQLERTRDVPIIFLTAHATDTEQIHRAYAAGAADYLVKPLDVEVVRRKVAVFLELVGRREEVEKQARALREADRREYELQLAELRVASGEELLAIVAHDLRSPLSAIQTTAAVLDRIAGEDGDRVQGSAKRILRSVDRMDRLIADLLDFALLKADRMSLERAPVAAKELVQESVESLRPLAREKRLQLEWRCPADAHVIGDRDRLLQVLSNLVGNALKFTPSGGSVLVRAECSGSEAVFAVSDSGPGMTDEEMSRIWDRYWQAHTRNKAGVGLGLSIAKGLVERHGGRIWVESKPGTGTTFFFTVPLATARDAREARDSFDANDSAR